MSNHLLLHCTLCSVVVRSSNQGDPANSRSEQSKHVQYHYWDHHPYKELPFAHHRKTSVCYQRMLESCKGTKNDVYDWRKLVVGSRCVPGLGCGSHKSFGNQLTTTKPTLYFFGAGITGAAAIVIQTNAYNRFK